jgi:anaerobic carbon-monoxide dehydrogenase iron sulfur subunit
MEASRIQVVRSWPNLPALEVCRFEDCPGKPCIPVCPVDAIMENGNMVLIDADVCTSCGLCVNECPFNAIVQTGRKPAVKCDFCGGDPKCVKECVTHAISRKES